jgi:nucleoside-diphosphate-sugar epimerase
MLSGEKILVTGPAGTIARRVVENLVQNNEVWGIARFGRPEERQEIDALGVITRRVDLHTPDFSELPRDFTYLLHLAVTYDTDYDNAIRTNAEGTGLLLEHCRSARAALVMSTLTVYKPHPDPWHAFREDDPLGDVLVPSLASYSIAKNCQEAVARFCARAFNLPVIIGRMGSAYGPTGGLPVSHLDALVAGHTIEPRWDPLPYSPIHTDDIAEMIEPLLGAAGVPANIVNFCGDEAVSTQEWLAYMGGLVGVTPKVVCKPFPGASLGSVGDVSRRLALTGPCRVHWRDGLRRVVEQRYPHLVAAAR